MFGGWLCRRVGDQWAVCGAAIADELWCGRDEHVCVAQCLHQLGFRTRRTGWHRHCVHLLAGETIAAPVWFTVIEAITASLGLPDDALELTWRSLSEVGNISSASVLHVLRDTMAKQPPSGSPGVLMAMGPGFCSEVVLLRWH
jgi:hypothetical protein